MSSRLFVVVRCHRCCVFVCRFAVLSGLTCEHDSMHGKLKSSHMLKVMNIRDLH